MTLNLTDLTTAIIALGLDQELTKIGIPFIILELHRRLFFLVCLYLRQKFATFFERPPLISGNFCSRKMPLDLDDTQIGLGGEALNRAVNELDEDGWN